MIEVENLGRTYKAKRGQPEVAALSGVSFRVHKGELFGILGPNGAGKTTLIRILSTLLMPSQGTASIDGIDVARNPQGVRPRIGVVFGGERGLYDRLTARDNMRFSAELYGLPVKGRDALITQLLDRVDLAEKSEVRVETFSRGMRQRLHIARALLHRPDVLFLDEPSNGLDPVAARELRRTVRELADGGTTIILTTHYMFEADELCDRVAVIVAGRVVAVSKPADLKAGAPVGSTFEFSGHEAFDDSVQRLVDEGQFIDVQSRDADGATHWLLRCDGEKPISREALSRALEIETSRVFERPPTLEDAYVALVSRNSES